MVQYFLTRTKSGVPDLTVQCHAEFGIYVISTFIPRCVKLEVTDVRTWCGIRHFKFRTSCYLDKGSLWHCVT
jgi:hypothetical protein